MQRQGCQHLGPPVPQSFGQGRVGPRTARVGGLSPELPHLEEVEVLSEVLTGLEGSGGTAFESYIYKLTDRQAGRRTVVTPGSRQVFEAEVPRPPLG